MRFLADASCDFAVVRALRAAGHDVRSVLQDQPMASDDEVVRSAAAEDRIVVAEDKDFGYLVHVSALPTAGVIFLRYPASNRANMAAAVCEVVARLGDRLRGAFVVVSPGKVRVTPGRR